MTEYFEISGITECLATLFDIPERSIPKLSNELSKETFMCQLYLWLQENCELTPICVTTIPNYVDALCIAIDSNKKACIWNAAKSACVFSPSKETATNSFIPNEFILFMVAISIPSFVNCKFEKARELFCDYFVEGKPHRFGECSGTGHYLCDSCGEKVLEEEDTE